MLLSLQSADTHLHRTLLVKSHQPTLFFLSESSAPTLGAGTSAGQITTDAQKISQKRKKMLR